MFQEPIRPDPPRRLVKAWFLVRDGLPALGRYRRYVIAIAMPLALIWGLAIVYLLVAPVRYTSSMILILPGSGAGGSLTVNDIGQASSLTSSAFSSSTLSPTENYKRLLGANITLRHAAARLGIASSAFPQPDVRLTDQTNLMAVAVKGTSPTDAHDKLEALRTTFLADLDALRLDEADKRAQADQQEIARLQDKARQAQQRLLDFQSHSGLVSVEQFRTRISDLDALKARYRDTLTTLKERDAQTRRLARSLDSSVGGARMAMLLKADPQFQTLLGRYAQIRSGLAEKSATLGDRHALVSELSAQERTLRQDLSRRGATLTGLAPGQLLRFVDLAVSDGRAALYQSLVAEDSQTYGTRAAVSEIARQIGEQNAATAALVKDASRLADLDRDLKVADAVFSSALARLDTNRADPFASYPLVQTLEAPSIPERKTSPSLLLALAGAIAASLLVVTGFGLAWIRQPIIQLILRKL
ncbi:hypothetical protein MTR62_18170 [Novosphingobium sp. 1949]|uniref:Lipopolysaccharide biosynthesis protein n=1 Tax=Novosphingobium organovorum TaxID=2930092 RepID=A0ABT0BHR1_9SPHN|nr:hypothetical protein [Novosphingobium organovorum]MCJ2184600.1 hypothetical protein [Novosphingobium organovorum]